MNKTQSLPGIHAASNSATPRGQATALPKNSQRPSLLNSTLGPESPAEHIRNSLQILWPLVGKDAGRSVIVPRPTIIVDRQSLLAIERRLMFALAQLERPRPSGHAAITDEGRQALALARLDDELEVSAP